MRIGILLSAVLAVLPAAAVPGAGPFTRGRVLMGTTCEVRAFGDEAEVLAALDRALDRIAEIEQALTTWRPDGELARLNATCRTAPAIVPVSDDLLRALDGARGWARKSGGLFDPAIGSLVDAWGLKEGGRVPEDAELERALALSRWQLVEIRRGSAQVRCLEVGVALDLGGYGKGFALDEAARVLREAGIESALFNFGGQVLALGAPPGTRGWIVDIAHPADRMHPVASLLVHDASVATSSNALGRSHVLDPRTGRPTSWRAAVTVVATRAADADALSTALLVRGPGRTPSWFPRRASFVALEAEAGQPRVTGGTPRLLERLVWLEAPRRAP